MDLKTFWENSKSTIISGVIAIVVIAGLFVLFNTLPATQESKPTGDEQEQTAQEQKPEEKKDEGNTTKSALPTKYTVTSGDSLWKISTRFYNTGYNWTAIAEENKLANPSVIHAGNVLTIPRVEAQAKTYTVTRGDSLWKIAQHFYGSGYEWYKIRDTNAGKIGKLTNGRPLIIPGQVLTIP